MGSQTFQIITNYIQTSYFYNWGSKPFIFIAAGGLVDGIILVSMTKSQQFDQFFYFYFLVCLFNYFNYFIWNNLVKGSNFEHSSIIYPLFSHLGKLFSNLNFFPDIS